MSVERPQKRNLTERIWKPGFTGAVWYVSVLAGVAAIKDYSDYLSAFVAWAHDHTALIFLFGGITTCANIVRADHQWQEELRRSNLIRSQSRRSRMKRP